MRNRQEEGISYDLLVSHIPLQGKFWAWKSARTSMRPLKCKGLWLWLARSRALPQDSPHSRLKP